LAGVLAAPGGGGIFAAVSLAAVGDSGVEFTDVSSPQPVIDAAKTTNIKTRNTRCIENSSNGMLVTHTHEAEGPHMRFWLTDPG
jgi:hypothetical protein